ncbi:MAG: sugar phosphate isomerase/epimerase [Eubacteriales bacterium]
MVNKIESGELSILDVMRFAAHNGAGHIELVPFGFTLYDDKTGVFNASLINDIKALSGELSLPVSDYAVLGDLLKSDISARKAEVERIKRHIDVAARLGIKRMRHDISSFRRPLETNTTLDFEREFPIMTEACRELADYAAQYGITTMVENHGFFVNGADRCIRLIDAVGRDNFRMLIDIGNFICVEDDPAAAVKKCLPFAEMIHLKDFYIRRADALPPIGGLFRCDSGCWFSSNSGLYMLRGSILGQGDLDTAGAIADIVRSGYNGFASVEFEGMEDNAAGSKYGLEAARYFAERSFGRA